MIEFTQTISKTPFYSKAITRLVGNTVLLKPLPKKSRSEGGIYFPMNPNWRDDCMQFEVLAIGPGRTVRKKGKPDRLIRIDLEPGDHVLTPQIHGNKFAFKDGSGWIIIEADEIVAKWKPNAS